MSHNALENSSNACLVINYVATTSDEDVKSFETYLSELSVREKLTQLDYAVCATLAQRQALAKLLKYNDFEQFVVDSCVATKASVRNSLYSLTIALYNSSSKFASKLLNVFDIECAVNVKVHSATQTQAHRMLRFKFNDKISKSLSSKKMQAIVKALAARSLRNS
jgi:hypothetical protein